MMFKKIVSIFFALCLMTTFTVVMSGCEDLGAYKDTKEYYNSFGDIALISATSKNVEEYSVENYFYNEEARENFLAGEDGAYNGVEYSDYVYMAVPFESDIDMDTFALFLQSQNDVSVYINVFITDKIPTDWKSIEDNIIDGEKTEETEKVYDDPEPETRVGEIVVHLKSGKWNSFVLDEFMVNKKIHKSVEIKDGQYILLQIRNNSGVRIFDEEKNNFVDPQTGLELQKAELTMTNLLIRALNIQNVNDVQGGE